MRRRKVIDMRKNAHGARSALSAGLGIVPGKRYVVTKASDSGTFEVGDHINMTERGDINCREAQGWIDACDVPGAMKGVEVEIDREWIERRRKKLQEELTALDA